MKILHRGIFKGREVIIGKGAVEEIESLNIEKNFETALDVLEKIRNTRKSFFDSKEPNQVNRTIYGRRKAIWKWLQRLYWIT